MIDSIRNLRTTRDAAARAKLIASINDSLALSMLSQQALGAQWSKLSADDRASFSRLLGQMLERLAYPKASEFFSTLSVDYGAEVAEHARRVVPTTVRQPEGGAVSIDYVMARIGARWRVVDIVLDGQSLAHNVAGQIQAVLKQASYAALVAQMEARLRESSS